MKKYLPSRGFTLVELLVVIAIISILATVGATIYSGAQKSARDAKRQGDIDALSKALEVNKQDTGYQPLVASQFSSGAIPTVGPRGDAYCINTTGATAPTPPWTTCTGGWAAVAAGAPTAGTAQFMVCASLEGSSTPLAFCRSNAQ